MKATTILNKIANVFSKSFFEEKESPYDITVARLRQELVDEEDKKLAELKDIEKAIEKAKRHGVSEYVMDNLKAEREVKFYAFIDANNALDYFDGDI